MKAWYLEDYTGLAGLRLVEDAPRPEPAEGEVLVRLALAALNPADRYLAEKLYPAHPDLPHILGRDGIGTVEAVGAGVSTYKPGDRVLLMRGDAGVTRSGTLAEYVSVPQDALATPPSHWQDAECAGAPLVYCTAYQALTQWGDLPQGATVLVTGASGGVGMGTIHLGRAMGYRVIGTSRSTGAKADPLREQGADLILDTNAESFRNEVRDFAGKDGVALIVDNLGGPHLPKAIDTLGFGGRVSCVGMLAGPVPKFNTARLFFKRLRIGGVAVGTYSAEEAKAAWAEVVRLMDRAGRRPLVDHTFPMDDVIAAFERLAAGPLGKVLVRVGA
ncbi:MAG: zinc-binding dehydrogenase [Sumerlaeia bacterium]